MKMVRSRLLADVGKPVGFTISLLLAFGAGVYWSPRRDGPDPYAAAPGAKRSQSRFESVKAEPEDFFPVAEFRQQAGIVLGCYDQLNSDPELYVDIARALEGRTPLFGLVHSDEQAERGRELIRGAGLPSDAMHFLPLPGNTIWVRDYAPFMVRRSDNSVGLVDAKYVSRDALEERNRDEEMASSFATMLNLPLRSIPLVIEGGNMLSNGDGTIITSSTMLQENRAYEFTERQLGDILHDYLGVRRWSYVLPLEGEPTGHVDMFVSLLAKNLAVVGRMDPARDPENAKKLDAAAEHISQVTTSLGPMRVFRIPMPAPWGGNWRSYTNVIMANGILLMPSFSDVDAGMEAEAESVYRSLLPGWQVKKINCDSLVKEEGQLHCISYNIPRFVTIEGLLDRAGVPTDMTARPDGKRFAPRLAGRIPR